MGCGPGPAVGCGLRAADAAIQHRAMAAAELGPAEEATLTAEVSAQGQEGGTAHGEAGGGRDALWSVIILPEMVDGMVGVYNGNTFSQVEIKLEMIGHYLCEFFITYKPVKHCRLDVGATHSSHFIPLK